MSDTPFLPDSHCFIAAVVTAILSASPSLNASMEDTIHHGDVLIINKKSYSTTRIVVRTFIHYASLFF